MSNACVIGYGVVGQATAEAFGIDKYYSRTNSNITLEQAAGYRYIFICLPTPTLDGKCFTQDIEDVIRTICSYKGKNIFIIRSTVYPGFIKYMHQKYGINNLVSNPEFLSEDTAIEDAKNPKLIVLGGDYFKYLESVRAFYQARFKYGNYVITDSTTSELIKYALNTFFTTKVIFANELYDYTQKVKANYEAIKKVLTFHPWGSKNHFTVFYKDKRGVHGKCLPKDTEAFANLTGSPFFKMLLERNNYV